MITLIQNMLMKHNKWLFSALLVVIIVTFVLTVGNQNFGGHRTYESESVDYYGYDLNNPESARLLSQHAQLSMGMDPEMTFSQPFRRSVGGPQDYALLRVAALGLANQVGIPEPTEEELKAFLRSRSRFLDPATRAFDPNLYTEFTDLVLTTPLFTETMVVQVLKEDFRIEQLRKALAGPGYVLPLEGETSYLQEETDWTVKIATFDYADFMPEITLTEEDVLAYYEQNPLRYTLPERVKTSVVRFSASQFIQQVTAPTEVELSSYFNRNRFRYENPPQPEAQEPVAPVTLADVRDRVLSDWTNERAVQLARSSSDAFSINLYENQVEKGSEAFMQALARNGGIMEPLEPYSQDITRSLAGLRPELLSSAWVLATGDRYFSDLAETPEGAALLIYEETLPEELQSLETVRAQVEASWLEEEKRRLFAEQAAAWSEAIKASAGTPEDFKAKVEALGFKLEEPETFKAAERPASLRGRAWDIIRTLDSNEVSEAIVTEPALTVAFVVEKNSPPIMASASQVAHKNLLIEEREAFGGWLTLREWTSKTIAQLEPEEEAL